MPAPVGAVVTLTYDWHPDDPSQEPPGRMDALLTYGARGSGSAYMIEHAAPLDHHAIVVPSILSRRMRYNAPRRMILATNAATVQSPLRERFRLALAPSSPEPCCARLCAYRPERVAWLLRQIETLAQSGWAPSEALASVLAHHDRSSNPIGPGSSTLSAATIVADLGRALQAGKRDPVSIAAYLCPWSTEELG